MPVDSKSIKLPDNIFDVDVNNYELLKLAYNSYLNTARSNNAITKTRGEVRGGGRKPWKQKGTGRARFGSIRTPIWRGGGVTFGPTGHENYSIRLSKESKRVALKQALTIAKRDNKIIVDDIKTSGKTKDVASYLLANKLSRNILIVVDQKTPELIRSCNNIPNVILSSAKYINVFNIINADHIILSKKSLNIFSDWLTNSEGEN